MKPIPKLTHAMKILNITIWVEKVKDPATLLAEDAGKLLDEAKRFVVVVLGGHKDAAPVLMELKHINHIPDWKMPFGQKT